MRGTLILLCSLLLLWIGGSSYWYICRIQGHCNTGKVLTEENISHANTSQTDEPEIETGEIRQKSDPVTPAQVIDSVRLATEYILENPSRTIFFKYAKYEADISLEDQDYFKKLRLYLENDPDRKIYVIGHSDSSGTPEGLVFASEQRAKFIKKAMMEIGIPETQIQLQILGEGYPIASNATAEGRAKNRRVEISLKNIKYNE